MVQFFNASGCWAANETQINELVNTQLDGIVTKTCTLYPKTGNAEPTFFSENGVQINSKGLPNEGYTYYKVLCGQYISLGHNIVLSVAWEENNTIEVLQDYDKYVGNMEKKAMVELNLSCPNLQKEIPAYNPDGLKHILDTIHNLGVKHLCFSLKLSPYLDHSLCNKIIDVINQQPLLDIFKYVVLSNSIPNGVMLRDHRQVLSTIYGGLSGKLNKYISLSNVHYFKSKLDSRIQIVGCGGIKTAEDVNDYVECGASIVQLGSMFYDSIANVLDYTKINALISVYKMR